MKQNAMRLIVLVGLSLCVVLWASLGSQRNSTCVSDGIAGASSVRPLVGAIRFDDWDPNNGASGFVQLDRLENDTSIRYRLPYHAVLTSPTHADIDENEQSVIDQDILYASDAGIDFWAINHYCTRSQYAYQLQKTSPYRSRIKYAFIESSITQCRIDQLLQEIQDPQYLNVLDGRPVIFLFSHTYASTGGNASTITSLRSNVMATVGKNPYIIAMDFTASGAASYATSFGADAISSYGGGLDCTTGTVAYSVQVACEESRWPNYVATGFNYIPTVTTGWDDTAGSAAFFTTQGTPTEIANHLSNALTFNANNSTSNPGNMVLISAWNELTENHYIVPYNTDSNATGTGRIDAIADVLR